MCQEYVIDRIREFSQNKTLLKPKNGTKWCKPESWGAKKSNEFLTAACSSPDGCTLQPWKDKKKIQLLQGHRHFDNYVLSALMDSSGKLLLKTSMKVKHYFQCLCAYTDAHKGSKTIVWVKWLPWTAWDSELRRVSLVKCIDLYRWKDNRSKPDLETKEDANKRKSTVNS